MRIAFKNVAAVKPIVANSVTKSKKNCCVANFRNC